MSKMKISKRLRAQIDSKRKRATVKDRLVAALMKHAEIELTCEPEELVIEGNCSAIDPQTDREQEKWVHDQLDAGNEWAWCCAHVRASYGGFHGDDYLGACSYLSEQDFRQPGGYYDQMVDEACSRLAETLLSAGTAVNDLLGRNRRKA